MKRAGLASIALAIGIGAPACAESTASTPGSVALASESAAPSAVAPAPSPVVSPASVAPPASSVPVAAGPIVGPGVGLDPTVRPGMSTGPPVLPSTAGEAPPVSMAPVKLTGVVTIDVRVVGGTAPSAASSVKRMQGALKRCYEQRSLTLDPTSQGKVVFDLDAGPEGTARHARIQQNTGLTSDAAACMADVLKHAEVGTATSEAQVLVGVTCAPAKP